MGFSSGGEFVDAAALRLAVLNSERVRTIGVLVAVAAMVVFVALRDLAAGYTRHFTVFLPFLAAVLVLEAGTLVLINRAIVRERDLSPVVRLANVLLETQVPTVAIVLISQLEALGSYGALVAPALSGYYVFIILSTLRLDRFLCVLTGASSALGFAAVTMLAFRQPYQSGAPPLPLAVYVSHALVLLAGGIIAAFVTKQIQGYLAAALREAELRRDIDRIHHELEIARSIQQGLLPKGTLQKESFQIAGWSNPADQTGGDYYDWQELPDGKLAITIADVTGHGIAPALMMAVCRAYARASFPVDVSLSGVLNRLNRFLVADLPQERFVTLAAVVLDPADCTMEILSAGHGPLLFYERATETVRQLRPGGIPLGLISKVSYDASELIRVMPGDMLVMLTDGFFEWEDPSGSDFGVERVERFLAGRRDLAPDEWIRDLHSELLAFARGTPQLDDMTALVIKRRACEAAA